MKILAVSDQVIDRLYSTSVKQAYPDLDMLIGCGDLPSAYLEFLISVLDAPLYYVPGNHDPANHLYTPGGVNMDGEVAYVKGLLIAGLGGSIYYPPGSPNQYSQSAMFWRVYRLFPKIVLASRKYQRPLDILITHSPPAGVHDDDDPTHRGLQAINLLLKWAKPRFMLHGHTMFYRQNLESHITRYESTDVMNVYPFRVFELDGV